MCALLARKPAPFHIVILTLSRVKTLDAHPELSNLIIWENLLGSIRKLHLAPVQALWWQTWTKQCNIIVDLGLQSEAAKRWPITLLLIQLFGNDSPALASVSLSHFILLSHCTKLGLMFTAAAESRETAVSITEGLLCCSTVMFGHSRLQMGVAFVCMKRILRQYAWASQVYVSKTPYVKCRSVYVCVCRCCAAQTWLFGGTDRQPQRGFSTGCSFLPDSSVTHHYILLKAVRATVTFYAAFEFPAPMFFSICGCMFRIVCLSCLYCLLFH